MWPPLASRQVNGGCQVERPQVERGDVAVQMVDGDQRQAMRPGERLRGGDADEQRADQPGPHRDGDRVDIASSTRLAERLLDHRRDELEMAAARDLGHDAAEARVQLVLRGDDAGAISPSALTTAAAVSSQDVSIPRITASAACVAPHDQRVFAVVGVVAAPQPACLEAELLVEVDRLLVRDAHLERVAAALVVARQLEEPFEQPRGDTASLVPGVDRDVHHVPRIDVPRVDT